MEIDTSPQLPRNGVKDQRIRPRPRRALILYGSETGNAQDVAEEIGRLTERHRFDATVLDADSVQLPEMIRSTLVVFVVSTTGQGEMPQNVRNFWKTLLSSALKPGIFRKVQFASFGIGDSSYARYNVASRMLYTRMLQLGAQPFCDRGEGNEQDPEGHSSGLRVFLVALQEALKSTFPLPIGIEPFSEGHFLEPKWRLQRAAASHAIPGGPPDGHKLTSSSDTKNDDVPDTALIPVQDSSVAEILSNDRITPLNHFQDVRLLDLRVDKKHSYGPGAIAVIYPKNFPSDIEEFIKLMKWDDIADRPIQLVQDASTGDSALRSPLRHLDLSQTTLTLRWLLENVLDFMSIPRRSFFSSLIRFAKESNDDEKYQKERLTELANPDLIDELWDYTTRPKRTILEVMMDFTTLQIPWQYAVSALPIMRGRQFSIASGGSLKQDDVGRTRLHLLVAIANPPSPIIKYRRRHGICTRYMATLEKGQKINIAVQQGYLDVKPSDIKNPVIMIGPGTGVAPMRSLIYERLRWAQSPETSIGKPHGLSDDILFFGCRSESADYFFRNEWNEIGKEHGFSIMTAFSRDSNHPKQYVQDQIRSNGERVCQTLLESRGKVYICGSSGNMPKGVREALLDVLEEHGQKDRSAAEDYLDLMETEGRYKQETW